MFFVGQVGCSKIALHLGVFQNIKLGGANVFEDAPMNNAFLEFPDHQNRHIPKNIDLFGALNLETIGNVQRIIAILWGRCEA